MFPLISPVLKSVMKRTVKVCIFVELIFCAVLVSTGIMGLFEDVFTAVFVSGTFLLIIPLAIAPCLLHYRTSQSTVEFSLDCIKVVDAKGECWRELSYDSISDVRVESISGFFYGQDRDQIENNYICVF